MVDPNTAPSFDAAPLNNYPDAQWNSFAGLDRRDGQAPVDRPVDSRVVADAGGTRFSEESHPAFPQPKKPERHDVRWVVIGVLAAGVIAAALIWGVPEVKELLDTVSTDDAFVSSHSNNVASRIAGLVTEVLVDQNDRVEPGMLLVKLDRQPYELDLAEKEAALAQAKASVANAEAQLKSQLAQARSSWYRRKSAQERLRQTVATLRAQVATLHARESSRRLAELDQKRLDNLVRQGSASQSELDTRNNTLANAQENVKVAWAQIQETRASIGLPPNTENPLDVPKNLEDTQSAIEADASDVASTFAAIGLPFDLGKATKDKIVSSLFNKNTADGLDAAFTLVVDFAPAVQVARASAAQAARQVDTSKLDLSFTEIRSEIAGYVQGRSVHPGNRVDEGQTLLSLRPDYVWVDANYKETQLRYIRIGMPVDLHVDAYPKRKFKGRVSGFSPGTGLSESLLPPQNATGNYIKVTQRLPVRIELAEPNPQDTPLFVGLSVVPTVRFKERATGPRAGERLHALSSRAAPDVGGGPAGNFPHNRPEVPTGNQPLDRPGPPAPPEPEPEPGPGPGR